MPEPSPDQQAIIDALVAGKALAFWPAGLDPEGPPGFILRCHEDAFQVRRGDRSHIGTFAGFDAAWAAGQSAAGKAAA